MANQVCETTARQLHLMAPDWVLPGKNVGMRVDPANECRLEVVILYEPKRTAWVTYDRARDLYDVLIKLEVPGEDDEAEQDLIGLYADQLGEFVWGEGSKPFTEPMIVFTDFDGNVVD